MNKYAKIILRNTQKRNYHQCLHSRFIMNEISENEHWKRRMSNHLNDMPSQINNNSIHTSCCTHVKIVNSNSTVRKQKKSN